MITSIIPLLFSALTINGTVQDPQGKTVPAAQVRLVRQDGSEAALTQSKGDGSFRIEHLSTGHFLLQVDKTGFGSSASDLDITGDVNNVAVKLQVSGVSQTVLVTAAGVPQKLDEISKAVSTVTSEEIQNRNEYALSDTLRTVPGVLVINGGGPGQNTSIRIRGLRADAAAVLVDGLRFRDSTTLQGDSSSFLSTLNIVNPDHIEILRGSGSSLYGTNAVGGVVNVVTREGGGPTHGDIQVEGGSLGMFRGRATISGGAMRDRLTYSAGFLHLNITEGVDGNDANRSTGGQGLVRYDLTPKMNITARVWGSDDFVQLNVSPTTTGIASAIFPTTGVIQAIPFATYIPGVNDPDSRRASNFLTGAFVFRHAVNAKTSWQASYSRVHTNRVYANGPAGAGFQPATSNYSDYAGDIDTADAHANFLIAPWLTVNAGYEFEHENYNDQQLNNLPAPRTITERTNVAQNTNAGYFASQLSFLQKRLQVSFSGRLQAFRLSHPDFNYTGATNPYATITIPDPKTALTGDVSVAYLIARTNTKLRAHFGNAYRAPSLYERFGAGFSNNPTTGLTVFTPYGDPRLSPDRYNSLDGGMDQYLFGNRVRVAATYFYTRVVSITGFDSSGGVQTATDPYRRSSGYINGSGGISRGAELSAEARPIRSLSLTGSYTYVRENTDRDLSVAGFFGILQVPAHTASLVATKYWGKRLDTTFDLSHYSSYDTAFFAGTRSRAFEFPGFTRAAAVGSYRVWRNEHKSARIYVKVDNVFNQRYYQTGWLAARATVIGGIGFTY